MTSTQHILTVEETDELMLAACTPSEAIEDVDVGAHQVRYFFANDRVATVNRITGRVTIQAT
jgi:hypothetical protein